MDESGDFWRSVTTEITVRHSKRELAPPAAFQSVLVVAAAVMQRGTPQKRRALPENPVRLSQCRRPGSNRYDVSTEGF